MKSPLRVQTVQRPQQGAQRGGTSLGTSQNICSDISLCWVSLYKFYIICWTRNGTMHLFQLQCASLLLKWASTNFTSVYMTFLLCFVSFCPVKQSPLHIQFVAHRVSFKRFKNLVEHFSCKTMRPLLLILFSFSVLLYADKETEVWER